MDKHIYTFEAKIKLWDTTAGAWHYVVLPNKLAGNIAEDYNYLHGGWGSLRVEVTLGTSIWKTSLFKDKKLKSYILPIKAMVRKKESVGEGSKVKIEIKVEYAL